MRLCQYVAKRLMGIVFVLWGVLTVTFFLLHFSGDPLSLFVSVDVTQEQIREIREFLGLDKPLHIQYFRFVRQIGTADLGFSLRFHRPVLDLILSRAPATLELTFAALFLSLSVGVFAGIVSAARRNSLWDNMCMTLSVVGQCMPIFWLGLLLISLFAVKLNILPAGGRGGFFHLILPAFTLGTYSMARFARLTRSTMLEVMAEDYIRTGRAKGLRESKVMMKHALKNASLPIVGLLSVNISTLLGGTIVAETVFAWPGMGLLLVNSVLVHDYPVVQGSVILIAILVCLITFITDLIYAYLDPRITYT